MGISVGYWISCASVMAVVFFLVGAIIAHHPLGILVDPRNKLSLSRLQLALWTLLILSAFTAVALQTGRMDIHLDPEVWSLMGISTASAAGATIIKSTKAGQDPNPTVVAQIATLAPSTPDAPAPLGVLATSKKPRFSDLFKGEEVVDSKYVDISKVQMFFFTIASISGYATALAHCNFTQVPAAAAQGIANGYTLFFPPVSAALVTLIGISHAGYLTVKAAPHTPTA
jgi:hypothetical protein